MVAMVLLGRIPRPRLPPVSLWMS